MNRLLLSGLVAAIFTLNLTGCSSSPDQPTATKPADAAHSGAHLYQCPMHPEVTSDKPGTCPKCGMTLEHTDNAAGSGRAFTMAFTSSPTTIEAGKPVKLAFRPQDAAAPTAPVPLAVVHEKKMHLIIVSRDLSEFYHEHPTFGADGSYTQEYTFKTGGDYLLFQDYTPEGDRHQLGRQEIKVAGATRPAVQYGADALNWKSAADGYTVALAFDQPVQVGASLALTATVTHNGTPVTDLANYLGALGHVVILSEDGQEYLHVHPLEQADKGPKVGFQTQFEKAGRYRIFLQFNHGGSIRTADFVVNVAPAADGKTAKAAAYECPMQCEGSASDKPGKCPMCGMELEKKAG
jgi:hypothetical protein